MFIMMKRSTKRALLILAIIIVAAVIFWGTRFSFKVPQVKGETLLTYVPVKIANKKPLIGVLGVNNFKQIYNKITKTNFYKTISSKEGIEQDNNKDFKNIKNKILNLLGDKFILAAYKSDKEYPEWYIISKIKGMKKTKNILSDFSREKLILKERYKNLEIKGFKDYFYWVVFDNLLIAGKSRENIKNIIDIKNKSSRIKNFNIMYPWVERKMNKLADGFVFSSNRKILGLMQEISGKRLTNKKVLSDLKPTYSEFFLGKGIMVKSYIKSEEKEAVELTNNIDNVFIDIVPQKPLLAVINKNADIESWWKRASDSEYFNLFNKREISLEDDVIPLLGDEVGYVLSGPEIQKGKMPLPNGLVFGEVENSDAQTELIDKLKKFVGLKIKDERYRGVEYSYTEISLFFGEKIQVCIIPLEYKGKHYVAIAKSKDFANNTINLSKGRGKNITQNPYWSEIKNYLPEKFSVFSLTDINGLSNTIGVFIADLKNDDKLEDFLRTSPFSWMGPLGSMIFYKDGYTVTHSYLPIKDLGRKKWKEIFGSLEEFIREEQK